MKIYGLNEAEALEAIALVSHHLYDGNLEVKDSSDESNSAGPRVRVTLRVVDSSADRPGTRGSAGYGSSGAGPHGLRRTMSACWHAHRDVLRAWFAMGAERVTTALEDYRADTFEQQFPATGRRNIGSRIMPMTMPETCECHPETHSSALRTIAHVRALVILEALRDELVSA